MPLLLFTKVLESKKRSSSSRWVDSASHQPPPQIPGLVKKSRNFSPVKPLPLIIMYLEYCSHNKIDHLLRNRRPCCLLYLIVPQILPDINNSVQSFYAKKNIIVIYLTHADLHCGSSVWFLYILSDKFFWSDWVPELCMPRTLGVPGPESFKTTTAEITHS